MKDDGVRRTERDDVIEYIKDEGKKVCAYEDDLVGCRDILIGHLEEDLANIAG